MGPVIELSLQLYTLCTYHLYLRTAAYNLTHFAPTTSTFATQLTTTTLHCHNMVPFYQSSRGGSIVGLQFLPPVLPFNFATPIDHISHQLQLDSIMPRCVPSGHRLASNHPRWWSASTVTSPLPAPRCVGALPVGPLWGMPRLLL